MSVSGWIKPGAMGRRISGPSWPSKPRGTTVAADAGNVGAGLEETLEAGGKRKGVAMLPSNGNPGLL